MDQKATGSELKDDEIVVGKYVTISAGIHDGSQAYTAYLFKVLARSGENVLLDAVFEVNGYKPDEPVLLSTKSRNFYDAREVYDALSENVSRTLDTFMGKTH